MIREGPQMIREGSIYRLVADTICYNYGACLVSDTMTGTNGNSNMEQNNYLLQFRSISGFTDLT